MSIHHDILTHGDFNRLTRQLDRNIHQYDPRYTDDDNFLQLEAVMMGLEFDCEDAMSTFLDEEFQDNMRSPALLPQEEDEVDEERDGDYHNFYLDFAGHF